MMQCSHGIDIDRPCQDCTDEALARIKESDMNTRHKNGDAVRINKPALREHGMTGVVKSYDEETQWYWIELDRGPPWRGKYEQSELEPLMQCD